MFQFSKIISLPVINIYNTRIEGVVENICVNNKLKVEYFVIYNSETDTYKTLSLRDTLSITESAIFIKNSSKITLFENNELKISECHTPINSFVYITGGEYVGKISEICFENKGFIKTLYIDKTAIESKDILSFNSSLTLLKSDQYRKLSQFSPRPAKITKLFPAINNEPIVSVLNTPSPLPQREMTNNTFLLNRQILKNIKNHNGEVLAKQNTLVTQAVIDRLKRYGKLKELMLNSK